MGCKLLYYPQYPNHKQRLFNTSLNLSVYLFKSNRNNYNLGHRDKKEERFWYAYGLIIVLFYLKLINWYILDKLNEQITHLKLSSLINISV